MNTPASTPLLTQATHDDVELLWPMMLEFYASEGITISAGTFLPALHALLDRPAVGHVFLVNATPPSGEATAPQARQADGYAVLTYGFDLEWAGPDSYLTELFLVPAARRHGLGARVMAALEEKALAAGAAALHLMVRPENTAAVALYRSRGFTSPPRTFLTKTLR
jgi:ribosomal protein S18 acetylase RimI-like enzyme